MVGAMAVVVTFAVFAWRGLRAGATAPDLFGRYLGWGFTGIVVLQALLNVSVTVALLPTKGIPLPFISYGGSSLVVTLCACRVALNIPRHGRWTGRGGGWDGRKGRRVRTAHDAS